MQKLIKLIPMFLPRVELMNVVEFRKIVTKVLRKHLITDILNLYINLANFMSIASFIFKTLSLE